MINQVARFGIFCFLLLSMFSCNQNEKTANEAIEEIRAEYAPDKRVALWDVKMEGGELTGETNLPLALQELEESLSAKEIRFENSVVLLPEADLDGKEFAIVTISVANIRSQPRHSAELSTQAIMGTPLNVLKKQGSWYLVQTPDRYLSWVDSGGIQLMNKAEFDEWNEAEKIIYTGLVGYIYETANSNEKISDLAAGNILRKISENSNSVEVALPDGRTGFVKKQDIHSLKDWVTNINPVPEKLIETAKSMMGVPYLWGGTSVKGMDCSGFTKTVYFLNGRVIPRDASQQIHEGEFVDSEKNWDNLEVGDLLFFGRPATEDQPERVIHVGMWIGNDQFIHASGRIRVSSFDEESPLFDQYNLNRYLRTKRILKEPSENVLPVGQVVM
ncbi:MAG: C40 family peptidase [Balneolaceae bacterium]